MDRLRQDIEYFKRILQRETNLELRLLIWKEIVDVETAIYLKMREQRKAIEEENRIMLIAVDRIQHRPDQQQEWRGHDERPYSRYKM
jgi:hypothetical protein